MKNIECMKRLYTGNNLFTLWYKNPLADLGGVPGTRPSKGPDSFVLTYTIFEMLPPWESTLPPTGNPGSATGITWPYSGSGGNFHIRKKNSICRSHCLP